MPDLKSTTALNGQQFLRSVWRRGLRPGSPSAVCFAIVCVATAAVVRFALNLIASDVVPFATFYPATLVATLVGGLWVGLLAAVLGGVLGLLFFKSSATSFVFSTSDGASVLLYLGASAVIVWGAEQYRTLVRHLDQEESFRQTLVDELGHRLQNKLATIHAILRYELRDQRATWDRISGRLQALSATDELIVKRLAAGIEIGAILSKELAPYDGSRAILRGPSLEVPAKLAVTLALVFHELATNAAKYGALAASEGRIVVSWTAVDGKAVIEWRESGGPLVLPPTRRGFGRRMIQEGLSPFGGSVACRFEQAGLECTIVVPTAVSEALA
jgi:two-component sensor histidine kinase